MKKLKAFIARLWAKIKLLFSIIPEEVKNVVRLGVLITESLKTFVDSSFADVVAALIPGTVDDKAIAIARKVLPAILIELKLVDGCKDLTDPNEVLRTAISVLQSLEGDIKSSYLHTISVLITKAMADGKLDWSDATAVVEWYYQNKVKAA